MQPLSEFELYRQLDLARGFVQGGDGREAGLLSLAAERCDSESTEAGVAQGRIRVVQIGVVQYVEEIGAEVEASAFAEPVQTESASYR